MTTTVIAAIAAVAALLSAIFAWLQAREARRQAQSAQGSARTARDAMLSQVVTECLEARRTEGQWQHVLDSHTELTSQERAEADRRVRIRLGKV